MKLIKNWFLYKLSWISNKSCEIWPQMFGKTEVVRTSVWWWHKFQVRTDSCAKFRLNSRDLMILSFHVAVASTTNIENALRGAGALRVVRRGSFCATCIYSSLIGCRRKQRTNERAPWVEPGGGAQGRPENGRRCATRTIERENTVPLCDIPLFR